MFAVIKVLVAAYKNENCETAIQYSWNVVEIFLALKSDSPSFICSLI